MTSETEARAEKIRKLIAKAESTNSEHEAQALFAKAEELMTQWAISDAMLQSVGKQAKEEVTTERVHFTSTYWTADMLLAARIGTPNNVKLLQNKQAKYIVLIGFPSDIANVVNLWQLLRIQSTRFAQQELTKDEAYPYMSKMDKFVWRRSFREGFADRVGTRLREQRERTETDEAKKHGSGMELVLVDRKTQVDQFFNNLSKSPARATRQRHDWNGSAAGRRAGDRADLGNRRMSSRKELS